MPRSSLSSIWDELEMTAAAVGRWMGVTFVEEE